jgi:hypothetical protein
VSTYVDGASPSVSPDPDEGAAPDVSPSSELDSGPRWVQAEIQRRIAANRTRRSRHARGDDAAPPVDAVPDQAPRGAGEPSADVPQNHVPRHGVSTSELAAPDAAPALSPAGLPVRRRRRGRGKPSRDDAPPAGAVAATTSTATADPAAPVEPTAAPEATVVAEPATTPEPTAAPEPVADPEPKAVAQPAATPKPAVTAAPTAVTAKPTPAETTDEIVDPPTAPHPIVLADRTAARRGGGPPARRLDQRRLTAPRPATPRSMPVVGLVPEPGSTRVRVVLSERKGVARPVRTIKEVQENTAVGDLLRRNLIRSQLSVTLRFAALTAAVLVALPALFAALPELGRFQVLGLRVPWLLLGVLIYPFLIGIAWWYTRVADRVEQNFADHVQD